MLNTNKMPYDIVAEVLDKGSITPAKFRKVLGEAYPVSDKTNIAIYNIASRYALQGGVYEVLLLYDRIYQVIKNEREENGQA